jgi:hypothetical protein
MAEERISIEAESDLIWLEIEGFSSSYSLRMLILNNRNVEGNWSANIVGELVAIARTFQKTGELPI